MDSPVPPGEKGLFQYLRRLSHEEEQQYRNKLLKVSKQDLKNVSEKYVIG